MKINNPYFLFFLLVTGFIPVIASLQAQTQEAQTQEAQTQEAQTVTRAEYEALVA